MILIDALFIANEGGGPNLLRYLIDAIRNSGQGSQFFFLLDQRFTYDMNGVAHDRLQGSLRNRYRFYKKNKKTFSKVVCFANTPPPVRLAVPVLTYFHNQMLLESTRHLTDKRYLRFLLRYAFVAWWNRNTDEYLVQTPHMAEEITALGLKPRGKCKQFPFFQINAVATSGSAARVGDFVYVSAASFYKNHLRLLQAWEQLFEKGVMPVLHLTVTAADPKVLQEIDRLQQKGVKVVNHGYTDPETLYGKYAFMVYPSLNESFGLSLIEGANAGMKILAADLPYVRSVVNASAYFDPNSSRSIADAVAGALQTELPDAKALVNDEINSLLDYILN